MASGGGWSRTATMVEEICEAGHQQGSLLSCYLLRISARSSILPHHAQQALVHLRRKVPCLRLCYEKAGSSTRFAETDNETIDFKVVDGDVAAIVQNLKTYKYNSEEGPLWCARFIYDPNYPLVPLLSTSSMRPDTGIGPSQDYSTASSPHVLSSLASNPGASFASSLHPAAAPQQEPPVDPSTGLVPHQPGEIIIIGGPNPTLLPQFGPPPKAPPAPPPSGLTNGTSRTDPASAPTSPPSHRRRRHYAGSYQTGPNTHCSVPARLDEIAANLPVQTQSSSATSGTSSMSAVFDTGSSSCSSQSSRSSTPTYPFLLLVGFHNGIADGFSALKICGLLIRLLDDVLSEVAIDDEQLGDLLMEGQVLNRVEEYRTALDSNQKLQKQLLEEMDERRWRVSALDCVFRGDETRPEEPQQMIFHFDSGTTAQFIEKCQTEGVKLHSAFCAVVNIVLVDLAVGREGQQDSYTIHSSHAVDLRRYWRGGDPTRALGCWVAPVHFSTRTAHNAVSYFWNYVVELQKEMTDHLESGNVLQDAAYQLLYPPAAMEFQKLFQPSTDRQTDYCTINLGNVSPALEVGGGSGQVLLDYVEISTSQHKTSFACNFTLYTFQGRLSVTLDYNSRYFTEQAARECVNFIHTRLKQVT